MPILHSSIYCDRHCFTESLSCVVWHVEWVLAGCCGDGRSNSPHYAASICMLCKLSFDNMQKFGDEPSLLPVQQYGAVCLSLSDLLRLLLVLSVS